jgi:HEAT repeat protein
MLRRLQIKWHLSRLDSSNPKAFERAARALVDAGEKRAVEPLIRALRHPEERIRSQAAGALGDLRDERAAEQLISSMKVDTPLVALKASQALKKIGGATALRALAKEGDADAAWEWAKLGGPGAADVLFGLAKAGNLDAAKELAKLGDSRAADAWFALAEQGYVDAILELAELGDPRTLPKLVEGLDSDLWPAERKRKALQVLRKLRDGRAVEALIHCLKAGFPEAAELLSALQDCRAVPALYEALSHSHRAVRLAAAKGLANLAYFFPTLIRDAWDSIAEAASTPHSDRRHSDQPHASTDCHYDWHDDTGIGHYLGSFPVPPYEADQSLRMTCPNFKCGRRLKIPVNRSGTRIECPACHQPITVPKPLSGGSVTPDF